MNFFIDENLSPSLAKALNHLSDLCDERHTVKHAREVNGGPGTPDLVWLEKLQKEGNWAIISKDRFNKGDPERFAFENAGLTIFNLGKDWNKKKGWETALQLIKWWPAISKEVLKSSDPMLYELPWGTGGKLKGRKLAKKK
ncbi:hypothetical protein HOP52_06075 [Halomonas campisalis]|uniref:VapC45 PIN like domain-containing protein n=1 Tax=Billgrantia campisalis TaxID=74661 RepID=A0ABS9P6F7_9GAMM|nr:hypothetical protein [Halomonas campisalis]MCG6657339.1 hypothetical protein [Halomonas campisalis]MDR5864118.1 hypothetical protein [Halomonas campisalis]